MGFFFARRGVELEFKFVCSYSWKLLQSWRKLAFLVLLIPLRRQDYFYSQPSFWRWTKAACKLHVVVGCGRIPFPKWNVYCCR